MLFFDFINFLKRKSLFLFGFLRFIIIFMFAIMDFFIILIFKNVPKNKKILVIQPDGIGDFIVWLDAAKQFKKLYKDYKIVLLCNKNCSELAKKLEYFDEINPFDVIKFQSNIFYRFSLLKNIRNRGYYKIINTRYGREFYISESMVNVSGAIERIGFYREMNYTFFKNWLMKISDNYYTKLIKVPDTLIMLERHAEFIKQLGMDDFTCSMPQIPDYALSPHFLDLESKTYYVLFPGASASFKRWPIERFSIIASKIYKETGWTGIICGDSNETFLGEYLLQNAKGVPLINLTGKTSLLEMASIMKEAAFVVTSDTCAVHMAYAVRTPSVVIVSISCYVNYFSNISQIKSDVKPHVLFHKMNCSRYCDNCIFEKSVNGVAPCIANVSVDVVWEEISSKLITHKK